MTIGNPQVAAYNASEYEYSLTLLSIFLGTCANGVVQGRMMQQANKNRRIQYAIVILGMKYTFFQNTIK